jgi:hypothetical protein
VSEQFFALAFSPEQEFLVRERLFCSIHVALKNSFGGVENNSERKKTQNSMLCESSYDPLKDALKGDEGGARIWRGIAFRVTSGRAPPPHDRGRVLHL